MPAATFLSLNVYACNVLLSVLCSGNSYCFADSTALLIRGLIAFVMNIVAFAAAVEVLLVADAHSGKIRLPFNAPSTKMLIFFFFHLRQLERHSMDSCGPSRRAPL